MTTALAQAVGSAHQRKASPGYALFVTIPFVGHVNPLLAQAEELARRGWRTAVATTSEARHHVEGRAPGVPHLDLGPLGPDVPSIEAFETAASEALDARGRAVSVSWREDQTFEIDAAGAGESPDSAENKGSEVP